MIDRKWYEVSKGDNYWFIELMRVWFLLDLCIIKEYFLFFLVEFVSFNDSWGFVVRM